MKSPFFGDASKFPKEAKDSLIEPGVAGTNVDNQGNGQRRIYHETKPVEVVNTTAVRSRYGIFSNLHSNASSMADAVGSQVLDEGNSQRYEAATVAQPPYPYQFAKATIT